MKKKSTAFLGLLGGIVLASCKPPLWFIPKDDAADYGERQQLIFYHQWQRGATGYAEINGIIKEFNASDIAKKYNVAIKGNGVNFWDYWDKVNLAISGGSAPDIYLHTVSDAPLRARYNLDLTAMEEEDVAKGIETLKAEDMFFPTQISDIAKYDENNHMKAWPFSATVRVVYYNKDLFKAAGITDTPKTWADMEVISKKLTQYKEEGNPSSGYKIVGYDPFSGEGQYVHQWGWLSGHSFWGKDPSNGRPVPQFNDATYIKNLESLYYDSYCRKDAQARQNLEDFMADVGKTGADPFVSGKLGMIVGNEGLHTRLKEANVTFDYGVFELPTLSSEMESTNWSSSYSIELYDNKNRNVKEEVAAQRNRGSWEFLKFLFSKKSQEAISKTGFLISNREYYADFVETDPVMTEVAKAVSHTREAEYISAAPKWTSDIQVYVNSVGSYKMSVQDAMDESQKLMESKIRQYYSTQN